MFMQKSPLFNDQADPGLGQAVDQTDNKADHGQADHEQAKKRYWDNINGEVQPPMVAVEVKGGKSGRDQLVNLASSREYQDRENRAWHLPAALQACNCVLQFSIVMGMKASDFLVKREEDATLFVATGTPVTTKLLKLLKHCTVKSTDSRATVTFQLDGITCVYHNEKKGQASKLSAGGPEAENVSCWAPALKGLSVACMDFLQRAWAGLCEEFGEIEATQKLNNIKDPVAMSVTTRYKSGYFVLLVRVEEKDWLVSTTANQVVRTSKFSAEQIKHIAENAVHSGLNNLVVNENHDVFAADGQAALAELIGFLHVVALVHVALGPLLRREDGSETTISDSVVAYCRLGSAFGMEFCGYFSLCEWTKPSYTRFIIAMLLPHRVHGFNKYGLNFAKMGAVKSLLLPESDMKRLLRASTDGTAAGGTKLARVAVVLLHAACAAKRSRNLPQLPDKLSDFSNTQSKEYIDRIAPMLLDDSLQTCGSQANELGIYSGGGVKIVQIRLLEILTEHKINLTGDIFKTLHRLKIFPVALANKFLLNYMPHPRQLGSADEIQKLLELWDEEEYNNKLKELMGLAAQKKEAAQKKATAQKKALAQQKKTDSKKRKIS